MARRGESLAERRERRAAVDDPAVVLEAALRFLEPRARSLAEVRRRLDHAGYRSDLVERAVERLLDLGMLDDEAFARRWVESRDRARPRGELALRRELRQKGVPDDLIRTVLEERAAERPPDRGSDEDGQAQEGADETAARRLLERRAAALSRLADPRARRQRAYALLARNGFDPEVCARLSQAFGAAGEPD